LVVVAVLMAAEVVARGQSPGTRSGAAALASATSAAGPAKEQDYKRLIDDLIAEESRAWMMNRYTPGSVTTNRVMKDPQGRAAEVDAGYGFSNGMSGGQYKASVRVTFKDGLPECLYFSDFPTSCRAPSPRIISAFEKNQYANWGQ
jgi:hypothetical protein